MSKLEVSILSMAFFVASCGEDSNGKSLKSNQQIENKELTGKVYYDLEPASLLLASKSTVGIVDDKTLWLGSASQTLAYRILAEGRTLEVRDTEISEWWEIGSFNEDFSSLRVESIRLNSGAPVTLATAKKWDMFEALSGKSYHCPKVTVLKGAQDFWAEKEYVDVQLIFPTSNPQDFRIKTKNDTEVYPINPSHPDHPNVPSELSFKFRVVPWVNGRFHFETPMYGTQSHSQSVDVFVVSEDLSKVTANGTECFLR